MARDQSQTHIPPKGDLFALLAITAAWVAMALLVRPSGDFPLNDDWMYGWTVRSLVTEGTLRILPVTSPTLLAQALWGALFCLPFGFSFTALRISTLTLGLAGVLAVYLILREAGFGRRGATLGAMTVAVNPIYFVLS